MPDITGFVRSLARAGAEVLGEAWDELQESFETVTRRARGRFEARDWPGIQADAVERLGLYRQATDGALQRLRATLGDRLLDRHLWPELKKAHSSSVAARPDRVLAETFLNSITRRVFATVGVDPAIEFVDSDFDPLPAEAEAPVYETVRHADARQLVSALLGRLRLDAHWDRLDEDVRAVAEVVEEAASPRPAGLPLEVDVVPALFFRNQGAYLVGRLRAGERRRPLLLALLHRPDGMMVDAALVHEDDAALVFSFTRSYFLVEVERPAALVDFLHALMPRQARPRDLDIPGLQQARQDRALSRPAAPPSGLAGRLRAARGDERGLVMSVFTLPSYDVVFKVIRDQIPGAQGHDPRAGHGEVSARLPPRPGGPARGRAGVRAPGVRPRGASIPPCSRSSWRLRPPAWSGGETAWASATSTPSAA